MGKFFNVTAVCRPQQHYMVDITEKLEQIKAMVDQGQYFTMNCARQYGKTTTLKLLEKFLKDDYLVISLDFQGLSSEDFQDETSFVKALSDMILKKIKSYGDSDVPKNVEENLREFTKEGKARVRLASLFQSFSDWCGQAKKPIVLMIDEVDSASNNQVFLDFLAQLRFYYIERDESPAFQSVILASVYDIKNLKQKFVGAGEHQTNSPWNIAADFLVDMSFSPKEIAGMLAEYEEEHKAGMEVQKIAELIYDYTSGYPVLVSRICKLIDEKLSGTENFPDKRGAWTKVGVLEAVKILMAEKNPLFESLVGKVLAQSSLRELLYAVLFVGKKIPYNPLNESIGSAQMFGFIKNEDGSVAISNRIFETMLYDVFLSEEALGSEIYNSALKDKNQFVKNGRLNMRRVLEKFVVHFHDLYGERQERFYEEDGRRYFLLYLKPIINGVGNYYIEAQTRDLRRTDVIVDYRGEQFVIELKIWHGEEYNARGEAQLSEYLDYYHLGKGYMISFNFNQKKEIGVHEIAVGDKLLVEAVV